MNQANTPLAIDFYFDFSCPYAYLGSTQLARIEAETGRPVRYKPFLLGGVFRALDQAQNMSTTLNEPKKRHNRADLIRWASWFDVPLCTPMRHPNRTVEALRVLLACPQERWREVIGALYRVYWVDGGDISDLAVLRDSLHRLDLDAEAVLSRVHRPVPMALHSTRKRTETARPIAKRQDLQHE